MTNEATNASRALRAGLLALLLALGPGACGAGAAGFKPLDASGVQSGKLYDLGVADANDDGNLDLFTTNHKFNSSLLLGDGAGGLTESRVALGLSPTQSFPGYEEIRRDPVIAAPGLYLYATDRDVPRDPFHIDAAGIAASGRLIFGAQDLQVESATGATTETTKLADGSTALDFEVDPGGTIDVSVEHIDLPIGVAVDSPADPSLIRVGADSVPATSNAFTLSLRDRHGFGFGDFDGDRVTDLFITTGGLGGEIAEPFFTGRQNDELLLNRPGGYVNTTIGSGLVKGACRGREIEIADFDLTGTLDLLESCEGAAPQIYAGSGGGSFTQVAAPPAPGESYRVIDLLGGRRPEIVVASGATVGVWRGAGGTWSQAQSIRTLNGDLPVQHMATGDVDQDGDLDLLLASKGGNTVLLDVDGRLRRRAPRELGLPERGSLAASFVDYDNDGDLDAQLFPQGLYEARKDGFRRTGKLSFGPLPTGRLGYAVASWPDLDEDGRRDPVSARGRGEFSTDQVVDVRRNTIRGGHWLELDLSGPPGNPQAIGASARVRTAAGSTWSWVGSSDDARYSSGHYRLYFGLGDERRIERISISWPDGERQVLGGRRADRVLRVEYDPAKGS